MSSYHIHGPLTRTMVGRYLELHGIPPEPALVDYLARAAIDGLDRAHVAHINSTAVVAAASFAVLKFLQAPPPADPAAFALSDASTAELQGLVQAAG